MSKTIDEKVVEMRFDNRNFEQNVKTTMTTLDKFKEKLNLTGAAKGLENIENQTSKLKFNGLTDGIEAVRVKFSTLEIFAITALTNIANSAVNAGKRIASALTIDPIKTGFNEYEQKMDAVRVIMASAGEAEGKTLDEVTAKIQELNKYADDTIYSFADMTLNIGKFTNAGVKLDDAVLAIKGISNEAARSGANANEASRAMYNFAQALSMGYVQLIDWKSIENANMATVEFKNTLLETAIATGKVTKTADGMYKTGKDTYNLQQMFKDGLKDQWLTSEILIDTLKKYADESTEFGQKMYDAAKQVTTVSKLWDTLREAAQSGWGQTWELIIGNLDEARVVLTNVSNVISNILTESANSRNEILKEWKELGGRDDLIDAFKNIYKSISSLLKPISEAFREIFPKVTGKDLANITKRIKEFTSNLILNKETSENLKNTFKGLFSVLKTGIDIIKNIVSSLARVLSNFKGLGSYILSITGSFGNWLYNVSNVIAQSNILNNVLNNTVKILSDVINGIKKFASESLKINRVTDIFSSIYNFIVKIGSAIGKTLGKMLSSGNLDSAISIINSGIITGLLLSLKNFFKKIKEFMGDANTSISSIKGMLTGVKDILKSYQKEIDSKTLMNIAKAIGILAASLWVLSTIDPEALGRALGGMTTLIIELLFALKAFLKITSNNIISKDIVFTSLAIQSLAMSLLILSGAMKILSTIGWDGLAIGLMAVVGGLTAMITALHFLPVYDDMNKATKGLKSLATALLIYSVAMKILSTIGWDGLAIGILGVTGGLTAMVTAINFLKPEKAISKGFAMIELAHALILLSVSLKILATMDWDDIGRSLTAMGGALLALTIAMKLLPNNTIFKNEEMFGMSKKSGLLGATFSLIILAGALKILATMSWDDIKRSLTVMGGALAELTAALLLLQLAKGSSKSAASILIMANSMIVLAGALKILATMSVGDIIKSLSTIAASLVIFGLAGKLLAPLVKTLLALSGAIALFGVSLIALGAGLTLIGTGIGVLKAQFIGGIDLILLSLKGLIVGFAKMLPELLEAFNDIIIGLCDVIIESAPTIVETILTLLLEVLKDLDKYAPMIISTLFDFISKVLDELANRMPELITGIIKVVEAIFKGFKEAINGLDPSVLAGFIENAKSLSLIFIILAGLSKLFPAAALGVAEFGVLVAELGAVMTALGALSKIPGLNDLVSSGGSMLENIGTGIGKFIGGIIGGIGSGISSNLPDIGKNLSEFMNELQPFIDKVKGIDSSVFDGIKNLSEGLLLISTSNFINGITNLFNLGGNSELSSFSGQLKSLGEGLSDFIKSLSGIDESGISRIKPACEAIKMLAEANETIPNEGGWLSNIVGDNTFEKWAPQLEKLGSGLNSLVTNLGTFGDDNVTSISSACEAIKLLAEANEAIPNEGGWLGKIFGDNSLEAFGKQLPELGKGLSSFVSSLGDFNQDNVTIINAGCDALLSIANLANAIDKNGGLKTNIFGNSDLTKFGEQIPHLGEGVNGFITALGDFSAEKLSVVNAACEAIQTIAGLGYIDLASLSTNLSSFGTNLIGLGSSISVFISDLSQTGLDVIAESITKVQELINMATNIASVSIESLSAFSDSLVQVATEGVNGFCEAFSGFEPIERAKEAIQLMLEAVLREAENHKDKFKKAFEELMKSSIEGAKSKKEEMVNTFKDVCQAVINHINSRRPEMVTAGEYFSDGFAEGIRNHASNAINAAIEMAVNALNAARQALDMHSPSKETELMGNYFGEGFVIGIKDYFSKVYDTAFDSGELAKSGLNDAITRIQNIIDDNIDAQPRITPILDLSNIKDDINNLNGILSTNSIGVNRNLNAISNLNLENQNRGNNTLSAIEKLASDLRINGGNTWNIYTQELDSDKLRQIVDYVANEFGKVYN